MPGLPFAVGGPSKKTNGPFGDFFAKVFLKMPSRSQRASTSSSIFGKSAGMVPTH
jgi:hypothetical protein